ncbi:hypothetical protein Cni_G26671 [Canna indica]|uniref:Pectinesterase n=1 Tax=Canna indica TaxID=4628 RepID=A0AAQ3QQL7_9LILI|nr:hypothetical protein Cni_G26671 [Canna indica]
MASSSFPASTSIFDFHFCIPSIHAPPFSMASSLPPLLVLLLLLVVTTTTTASASATPSSSTPAINQACRATRTPGLCVSALSQFLPALPHNASGSDVALHGVSTAIGGVRTARANAQAILFASASNVNQSNVARTCLEILLLAKRRLRYASQFVLPAPIEARALVSAAHTYQSGCLSALNRVNTTKQVVDAAAFLERVANLTGYLAAMVANLQRYGGKDMSKWALPQTERDGYWPPSAAAGGRGLQKKFPPPGQPANATVCKGEGCVYETVQAAVDAAPLSSRNPFVIHIKEGVYEETVRVSVEKTQLVFIGDGMGKTVITGNLSVDQLARVGLSTYNTATVGVNGDGFMARDLTIANTAGPDAHQAVAFRCDSDHAVLESVEFLGHQDTLYADSLRQFYNSCRIAGTIDFIFGFSAAVFQRCNIVVLPRQLEPEKGEKNTVTAHGRIDPAHSTGFVFDRCVVNSSEEYLALYRKNPAVHRTYLGRPWKEYSRTVFINCYLAEIVRPEGWLPWSGEFALPTLYYGEFRSSGPGAKATARVPWSSKIPEGHLASYSLENFLQIGKWQ